LLNILNKLDLVFGGGGSETLDSFLDVNLVVGIVKDL
jgi:hypothetical protein